MWHCCSHEIILKWLRAASLILKAERTRVVNPSVWAHLTIWIMHPFKQQWKVTFCHLYLHNLFIKLQKWNTYISLFVCLYGACVRESSSHMWIYVFLGNALRGIGETPVTPLGISYIDDFAKAENSPFYIGRITLFIFRFQSGISEIVQMPNCILCCSIDNLLGHINVKTSCQTNISV